MKSLSSWMVAAGLGVAVLPVLPLAGAEPAASGSTNRVAPRVVSPTVAPAATGGTTNRVAPSITQPVASPASAAMTDEVVIAVTPKSPATQPGEDTQRRLEPPTPEELMEKYGSVGFLVRQPEPRNFVEMINPFAPATYGGKRREIFNRDPNLKPGAVLPRTFIRDGIRNEPDLNLLSWPW